MQKDLAPPPSAMLATHIVVDALLLLGIAFDTLTCALCVRCVHVSHIVCVDTEKRKEDILPPV